MSGPISRCKAAPCLSSEDRILQQIAGRRPSVRIERQQGRQDQAQGTDTTASIEG